MPPRPLPLVTLRRVQRPGAPCAGIRHQSQGHTVGDGLAVRVIERVPVSDLPLRPFGCTGRWAWWGRGLHSPLSTGEVDSALGRSCAVRRERMASRRCAGNLPTVRQVMQPQMGLGLTPAPDFVAPYAITVFAYPLGGGAWTIQVNCPHLNWLAAVAPYMSFHERTICQS